MFIFNFNEDPDTEIERSFAAGIRQMEEEEGQKELQQQNSHDLELACLEAKYQTEIAELRQQLAQQQPLAPVQPIEVEMVADAEPIPIGVEEMIDYVKREFSQPSAVEFSLMLYRMANVKNFRSKSFNDLINSILDAVRQREVNHQTYEMPNVNQVNINPQQVINQGKEENNHIR